MKIETARCIIRNFTPADQDDLCAYMLERVDALYEGYPDFTAEKSREEILHRSQSDEFFAIELKESHRVIGNVYLGKREFSSLELGYVLHSVHQGKGYGSEACGAAVEYFFEQGVHRIYAECAPGNTASRRLLEKLGFSREGLLRQNVSFHKDKAGNPVYFDTCVYGRLNPRECSFKETQAEEAALGNVMVDCADAKGLQRFYGELLSWEQCECFGLPAVRSSSGIVFLFAEEPDYLPPIWPEKAGCQQKQLHFDFQVEDVLKTAQQAERLGAVRASSQFGGGEFLTLLDPAGHPFCLCKK